MHVRVGLVALCIWLSCTAIGAASASPQTRGRSTARNVSGVVSDETGGVLPSTRVELTSRSGAPIEATTSDAAGHFQFGGVSPGDYVVRASFAGLTPAAVNVRVRTANVDTLKLTLQLAAREESVTVSSGADAVSARSDANLDAIAVDQDTLKALPVFDLDYLGALSRFVDDGATGGGGATLVVNGMEVSALRVSSSAIQQIKINQDPYGAEYSRPGRGRIEVMTKPGDQHYTGEVNFVGRDARLDARNAFLKTRPAEQKRIFDGTFGGPVGTAGKTSFMFSGNHRHDDQQGIVVAVGPNGPINDAVPQPRTEALTSGSLTHQFSPQTTIAITPSTKRATTRAWAARRCHRPPADFVTTSNRFATPSR
jgi:hypothetical protein